MTTKETPTGNKYWLKMHQITAFWHGFGISNGLEVPSEHITEIYTDAHGRYTDTPQEGGKKYARVSGEYMREQLKDYIRWLKSYGEKWTEKDEHPHGIDTREKFLDDEKSYASRADILEMIELLQEFRINDK